MVPGGSVFTTLTVAYKTIIPHYSPYTPLYGVLNSKGVLFYAGYLLNVSGAPLRLLVEFVERLNIFQTILGADEVLPVF